MASPGVRPMLLALGALLAAGCLGAGDAPGPDPGSPGPGPEPPAPPSPWSLRPEMVGCTNVLASHLLERGMVQALLPPGYEAMAWPPASPTAQFNLEHFACDTILLDNQTVVKDGRFAIALTLVQAPPGAGSQDALNSYAFEAFTDEPLLADLLARLGAPVRLADLAVGPEATRIAVDGVAWYSTTSQGPSDHGPTSPLPAKHHFAAGGAHAWFFGNKTFDAVDARVRPAATAIGGGVLSGTPAGAAGQMGGLAQTHLVHLSMAFGRHDPPEDTP